MYYYLDYVRAHPLIFAELNIIMENLYLARQPIYHRDKTVIGYELLYRSSNENAANVLDNNAATLDTILNSFMHIGLENIVGSSLAFLNLPADFVTNQTLTPMFKGQCVLEILESVPPTTQVISGLKYLKQQGYQIALDDFEYSPKHRGFLELADYVKIDVNEKSEKDIQNQLQLLKPHKVKVVAEKVETPDMHQLCMKLDFDFFQGYFYCRPLMISQKYTPANKLVAMDLLSKLQNPNVDLAEIETVLSQDVTLAYKLLRYINSATFSRRKEISSIKDAVVMLGISNVRNWLSLILMSKILSDKPAELIVTAMVRGKMCELLAIKQNPDIAPQMFITGLFTVIDALMDRPMADLLDTVILSIPIRLALLDRTGAHGEILNQVLQYEEGNWDQLLQSKTCPDVFRTVYLEAIQWADATMAALR
jgi:c-di-GMP phosphodiesterase